MAPCSSRLRAAGLLLLALLLAATVSADPFLEVRSEPSASVCSNYI